ncbi:MAG: hypothetical protein AMK70_11650 [Nitrospira bacterium SG8_35_1]|nr:MAG: hypothetical protein AMK70_11650 [Nitrospira bacterium SG8_35_1]
MDFGHTGESQHILHTIFIHYSIFLQKSVVIFSHKKELQEDTGDWVAGNIYTFPPFMRQSGPPHLAASLIFSVKGGNPEVIYLFSLK